MAFFRRLNGGGLDLASARDMSDLYSRSLFLGSIALEMQSRSDLRWPPPWNKWCFVNIEGGGKHVAWGNWTKIKGWLRFGLSGLDCFLDDECTSMTFGVFCI